MQNQTTITALTQGISIGRLSEIADIANDDSEQIQIAPANGDAQLNKHEDTLSIDSLVKQFSTPVVQNVPVIQPSRLKRVDISSGAHIIFFGDEIKRSNVHFIKSHNRYIPCNGDNCVLCKAGFKVTEYYFFPTFSLMSDTVEVLVVSVAMKPGSLLPKLLEKFAKYESTLAEQIFSISKVDQYNFKVATQTYTLSTTNLATISTFIADYKAQNVALSDVFQTLSNEDILVQFDEVRRKLRFATLEDTNVFKAPATL
jgi:hypothetical protein